MKTPVLLLVYNRLENVKKVLAAINEARPNRIFIAGDGPKIKDEEDRKKVGEVREYILSNIEGDPDVETLFQPQNLGVKRAVYEGLTWFFTHVERGIILEDDCLPGPVFFDFCDELLELYKDSKRIGMISGRNELGMYENHLNGDYFLSTRSFIWGWATWRDRIVDLDIDIHKKLGIKEMFILFKNSSSFREFIYRRKTILDLREEKVDTWDYQWSVSMLLNNRYSIVPRRNLVKNLGLGEESTHKFRSSIDNVIHHINKRKIEHPEELKSDKNYTEETLKQEGGKLWIMLIPRFILNTVRRLK